MLEVQEAATDPQTAMARSLAMREAAKISIIKADNDGRLRRARLRKAVPQPPMFEVGAYVYFRHKKDKSVAARPGEDAPRHQQSKNQMYQWFGIARAIGREKMSSEELQDRDLHTTEHTPHYHAYWLRYKNGMVLAAPEQMGYATEDGILAASEVPES